MLRSAVSTTRARLVLLVAAILGPLVLFAFLVFLKLSETEQARYSADAIATARQLSDGIDRELEALTAALEALAASPSLEPGGDLTAFRHQADQVLRSRGYSVTVRDRTGQQIVSTLLPPGAPLPMSTSPEQLAADRMVFETGARVISDLFYSMSSQRLLVVVDQPVFRGGEPVYALSIAIDPAHLSTGLAQMARPDWTLSLVDRNFRIIATSRHDLSYIGRTVSGDMQRQTGKEGVWHGRTLDGVEVLAAYSLSSISHWRVGVGVPLGAISAPLQRLTWLTAVSALLIGLLALGFARELALTISRPIARLAQAAERLGAGEKVPVLETGLLEVDEVGAVLMKAQATVSAREAALLASEERFRAAVRAVEGWMWTTDADGKLAGEQPAWSTLTGQRREQYEDYGWIDVVHPEDRTPTLMAWQDAVRDRRTFVFEHRMRRADGVYRRFSIRAVPILDQAGEATQWIGVHTDVTEEHEARAQLASQEAALRDLTVTLAHRVEQASAERDRIWRISTELMLVAQISGQIIAVNPAWTQLLGWSEGELLGTSFFDLVHPDDVALATSIAHRLADGAVSLGMENRYRGKDGEYRWLSWTVVPEAGVLHAIGRDVTAEKKAAETLRRTEEQLRQSQKMEVVGQLTGGVSHDFNNLLTVVTGHLEMARRRLEGGIDVKRLQRHLDAALEGARRAAVLTHRLLAFSRQSPLQPQRVELNAAIAGMEDLIRRTLGETIETQTRFADALWPVEADLNQIENAILNLCINARDAMVSGSTLRISTFNRTVGRDFRAPPGGELEPGDYAVVEVADDGAGIPLEIQDRVFEPFFTTKPTGKGTGLGLSQVFGFMRQSGGVATIASIPGQGTTVSLYFPRSLQGAVAPPEVVAEPLPPPPVYGERVLVVEDEDMVRDFSVAALEEAGYRVLAAADGTTGLRLLDLYPDVALLFTDIVLAGAMDGRTVATEAIARRPGLKILLTTGYMPDAAVPQERAVIPKPFTATALIDKISAILTPGMAETDG